MTNTSVAVPASPDLDLSEKVIGYWGDVWRRFLKNKLAVGSLGFLVLLAIVSIFAPLIAPYGYDEQFVGPGRASFSAKHWLGTDNLGRDQFSRVLYGAAISMRLAVGVTLVATFVSMLVGGLAAWFGGWFDSVSMRLADIIFAVPYIVIAFAALATFGRSIWTLIVVLVIRGWGGGARLFRASVFQVRDLDYIEAARASGAPTKRILLTHILPNAIQPIIVSIGLSMGAAIVNEAAYAFLGVGFIDPTPSWGVLLAAGRGEIFSNPHLFLVPTGCLVVTVLAFLFVAEGIRDASDPRLRGS